MPELGGATARHPVLIVGAGPIGMTAALVLARYGIRSVLIDRKDTFNDGSRAICIARPSMHILERIGAVAPFVEKALGWRFGRSYYRGEQIFRLEMPQPPGEKYLPMYNLQQQYIEQFLHDAVAASDLIDMRWQSELSAIEPHDDGVSVRISSPAANTGSMPAMCLPPTARARPSGSMLGLRLKGDNYEGRYVIADIRMDHDFPTERRAFFEPSGNPGGTVLIHKQPEDIWRVDYQLREGESEAGCPEGGKHPRPRRRHPCRYRPHKPVGTGMVERLFRQHPVPRRLPARTASSSSAMPRISCRFSACAG